MYRVYNNCFILCEYTFYVSWWVSKKTKSFPSIGGTATECRLCILGFLHFSPVILVEVEGGNPLHINKIVKLGLSSKLL